MAITLANRPQFLMPSATAVTATVSNGGGLALFTRTAHGLSTNSLIYIYSNLDSYNGEWRVEPVDANSFNIRLLTAVLPPLVPYFNSGTVTYYTLEDGNQWSCAHLPMVYILRSDKWPVNSVDTARTVSSFSNSNGYTSLVLSGDIKASGSADALEQVKISGTAALDGIYKILSWTSDVNFVIDLSYSSANAFGTGTVQYYYGNYHGIVKLYTGLPTSHYWGGHKPWTLTAQFEVEFDSSNLATFNVNEYIKKGIKPDVNNLLLDTLPNNTDAFCMAYIEFAESYDDANQYGTNDLNVSQYISPYVADSINVKAINASLPFKTRSGGVLMDYVMGTSSNVPKKFLTGFTRPVLFVGNYFDVSFIVNDNTMFGYYMLRRVYLNNVLQHEFVDAITDRDAGVYRQSIAQSAYLEDKIEITLFNSTYGKERQLSETLTIDVNNDCSAQDFYVTWLNSLGGYDYWNFKGETVYGTDTIESKTQKKNLFTNWPRSFSEFSDSIEKQTVRRTRDNITLNSQYLESDQMDGLALIFESLLVQQMTSIYDKRTIILDGGSFNKKIDNQKLLMVTIQAKYTDENPSQSL